VTIFVDPSGGEEQTHLEDRPAWPAVGDPRASAPGGLEMRRTILGAALAAELCAVSLPASAAAESPPSAKPDLSVAPPQRDEVLLLLESDPDLHARAVSGRSMRQGGTTLAVLGGLAVPAGLLLFLSDSNTSRTSSDPRQPAHTRTRGLLITSGGVVLMVAGSALVRAGDARRAEALREHRERHRADPPAR
jgi:hypothetical protein